MRLSNYKLNESAEESDQLNINTSILDELVELVGSEEEVEEAAELAYNDLVEANESGEVEMKDEDVPENLALAALVIKLAQMGKIEFEDAEAFITDHLS